MPCTCNRKVALSWDECVIVTVHGRERRTTMMSEASGVDSLGQVSLPASQCRRSWAGAPLDPSSVLAAAGDASFACGRKQQEVSGKMHDQKQPHSDRFSLR